MKIAVTGHRPQKLGGFSIPNPTYNFVYKELVSLLEKLQPEKAISGMALGVDQIFAVICIRLNIPFIAAVPFIGQESNWPNKSQEQYKKILSRAESVHVVCDGAYAAWKLQKRNEWMIDNADALIAVHDGSLGGTANAVNYAISVNKIIYKINPLDK